MPQGPSIKKVVTSLLPLRHGTIRIGTQEVEAEPVLTEIAKDILKDLGHERCATQVGCTEF